MRNPHFKLSKIGLKDGDVICRRSGVRAVVSGDKIILRGRKHPVSLTKAHEIIGIRPAHDYSG